MKVSDPSFLEILYIVLELAIPQYQWTGKRDRCQNLLLDISSEFLQGSLNTLQCSNSGPNKTLNYRLTSYEILINRLN